MKFNKLFEIQSGLDYHIVKEKGLKGQDLLDKKILALQVELGELANEWRGFKFWSNDQEPRTKEIDYLKLTHDNVEFKNPLLEEYVDCLHFILSIGLELEIRPERVVVDSDYTEHTATETFNKMFSFTVYLKESIDYKLYTKDVVENYVSLVNLFIGLGEEHLGFTWEQIEQAYLDKNKTNHERQLNGY